MIQVKKKRLSTQMIVLIAMTAVLILVIAGIIIARHISLKSEDDGTDTGLTVPELLPGEALYNGYYRIAYPHIEGSEIADIRITSHNGTYRLYREGGDLDNPFIIYFTPEGSDEEEIFYPPIMESEADFDYTSLYATEESTGYGIPKIYYVYTAIGTLYVDSHIEIPTGEGRDAFLEDYGLSDEDAEVIQFAYFDEEDKPHAISIKIGNKTLEGKGYYYMVAESGADGKSEYRNYVYVTSSDYFDYALAGAASLINATLVAEGLEDDSYLEPYLTTDFKQWVTHYYNGECHTGGAEHGPDCKLNVQEDSNVLTVADILVPWNPEADDDYNKETPEFDIPAGIANGYIRDDGGKVEFDLSKYKNTKGYSSMIKSLVGKAIGSYEDNPIIFTLVSDGRAIHIPKGESVKYVYTVSAIEAVVADSDVVTEGTVVGDVSGARYVKVTYTATADTESTTPIPYHAVIDLENPLLPQDAKAAILSAKIGALSDNIRFEITYSESTAQSVTAKLVIDRILAITDKDGTKEINKVEADSMVVYSYHYEVGGVSGDSKTVYVELSKLDESTESLRDKLVGKTVGECNITVGSYTQYSEVMLDFYTNVVKEITGFVTSEIVVSFNFVNIRDRDPFYGESIYENTLTDERGIYGLNNGTCNTVVEILGGLEEVAGNSEGIYGEETLAIGLSTDVMIKYHLYDEEAYRIYFELPRDIYDANLEEDGDELYAWGSELGFTLYVSGEFEEEGEVYRYVASDMYQIVTKIPAEKLVFLKYDFVDMWARRKMLMLDIEYLEALDVEFNMDGVYGKYNFDITHTTHYIDANGNHYTQYTDGMSEYDYMTIVLSQGSGSMETEFSKYLQNNGLGTATNLADFYNATYGGGKPVAIGNDTADVAQFKSLMQLIYFTDYTDTVPRDEQADILNSREVIMKLTVSVKGDTDKYVYEFRRYTERQIMVTLSRVSSSGVVLSSASDFYLSSAAARKIVSGFLFILSGKEVDGTVNYPD